MYQSATVIWFDSLKGIGEASNPKGKTIFLRYDMIVNKPFKNLQAGESISCKTIKTPFGNLFAKNIRSKI